MESNRERIRKAINKALKQPVETVIDPTETFKEVDASLEMVGRGKLPNRIVAKVPEYLTFIKEFTHIFATKDKSALVQLVLSYKSLVYDDIDFTVYLAFIIKRHQKLGETQQATAISQLLEMVRRIGLLYG